MTDNDRENEVDFVREQWESFKVQLARSSNPRFAQAADSLNAPEVVLRPPTALDYRLPLHFQKTMAPDRLCQLRLLLTELKAYCTELAGLTELQARVVTNGDETAILLRDGLAEVMVAHFRDRVGRPAPKDRGQPFRTWLRLYNEFGQWFSTLCFSAEPGHRAVLLLAARRLNWEMFHETWEPGLELGPARMTLTGVERELTGVASRVIIDEGWDLANATRLLMAAYPAIAAGVEGEVADLRSELLEIARDLREVKALLIRGYQPEKRPIQLSGGLVGAWRWEVDQRVGSVTLDTSPARLAGPDCDTGFFVSIGLDGCVCESVLPWLDLGDDAVRWSVGLLRPIREQLVADWLAVDRPADITEPFDEVSEGEVVAFACEALADDSYTEVKGSRYRHRVPAVREQTLLNLMQRHFGCEVRNSKGSEVTIYRQGGVKYTLGASRRGQHLPSHVILAMLKRLGIGAAEFAAVARKRS